MTMGMHQKGSQHLKLVRSDRCLCPLCHNPRASFYCSGCIRFGDSSNSNPFTEKRARLKDFSLQYTQLSQKIRERLEEHDEAVILAENKRLAQLRIRYLEKIIEEKRKKCQRMKKITGDISSRNSDIRLKLQEFAKSTMKMRKISDKYCNQVNLVRSNLADIQIPIARSRIKHLNDLVELIFPIEKIHRTVNRDEVEEDRDEVADGIAEAMRTSLVHGRWITVNSENSEEIQYRIVNPTLPSTGNYHYGASEDQAVMINSCSSSPNASEVSLLAGLSYVLQLIKLFALFTDVILPQKMSLSDFYSAALNLSGNRFARCVAALNYNVVYLLCSIDDEFIIKDPLRTLQNIHSFMIHLQSYPTHRLSTFNDQQIKDPEALVCHTKKIFAEVEKIILGGEDSSDNDEKDYLKEFEDNDVDGGWVTVSDNEPNNLMTTPPSSLPANMITSFLRGFSGGGS